MPATAGAMMPLLGGTRSDRPDAPVPFSSEWMHSPQSPPAPRWSPAMPSWMPGERALSATLVLLVVLATMVLTTGGEQAPSPSNGNTAASNPQPVVAQFQAPAQAGQTSQTSLAPLAAAPAAPSGVGANTSPSRTTDLAEAPAFSPPNAAPVVQAADGSLLPTYRILTHYGHPHDPQMGIIGEYSIEEIHEQLIAEASTYEAADPNRPVKLAFELIATVAQPTPGEDGSYILDTDIPTLTEYVDYADENDMLVFLDLQIGRGTVAAEIEKIRSLLERPNVHLALDPEFAVAEGETPGDHIGELSADSITYAQETLAQISADADIPPKVLIVHQFREDMILGKERIAPVPGVQLVIDADGFGAPELKTDVYNILVRDEPIEFAGVKLFYRQDKPLMSAAEILALRPAPDLIIYQ